MPHIGQPGFGANKAMLVGDCFGTRGTDCYITLYMQPDLVLNSIRGNGFQTSVRIVQRGIGRPL